MDLKVPITITHELTDEMIVGSALLNLASGEIERLEYPDYDLDRRGLPWDAEDYEFTSGTLSNRGRDVEFGVIVNQTTSQCSVSATELLEIKLRAAALFAGITDATGLAHKERSAASPAPAAARSKTRRH